MSVCLVTAPTATEFTGFDELSNESIRWASSQPQLGVLSLAAVVENRGDDLQIVNLNRLYFDYSNAAQHSGLDFAEAAAAEIGIRDADLYGFSSICSSYPLTIRIAKAVKSIRPSSMVLLGGPQASVVDLHTLAAFPFVDFVLRGEAERSLPILLDYLRGQRRLEQVPGLSYRVNNQPYRNPDARVIDKLDDLPMPAYHLTGELKKLTTAALELGRGCPYACTFCSTNDFFRRNFRLRSPQRVLLDMRSIAAEYAISDFELVHDMFTIDRRRVVAFCEAMIGSGENFTWSCSARTDCVDHELLEIMARAGCTGIFYGVEVGSAKMQQIINKHLDLERAKEIIDKTERVGIHSTVSMIIGFPDETWQDVKETVQIYVHSARCPNSSPQLNLLAPLSETPIYSKYKDSLILDELCSDMSHQGQSQDEADLKLIRDYPHIFPNFYLLPTPYLDRDCLLEFREFALNAINWFRWLVVAIDQNTSGIADFFLSWRAHRLALHPGMKGSDLRRYYRTEEFRSCFLAFVRQQPAAKCASVETFLDFEDAVVDATSADKAVDPRGCPLAPGSELWWSDITVKRGGTTLIEFLGDIQGLIDGLRSHSESTPARARRFYVVGRSDRVEEVSDWIACVLRSCDGRHTVREVVKELTDNLKEVDESISEYVFVRLLEGAWARGFIDIYRPCLETETPIGSGSANSVNADR
jgi:radical SAM superfamily enzyme YgiQ (UPF0313 family)